MRNARNHQRQCVVRVQSFTVSALIAFDIRTVRQLPTYQRRTGQFGCVRHLERVLVASALMRRSELHEPEVESQFANGSGRLRLADDELTASFLAGQN